MSDEAPRDGEVIPPGEGEGADASADGKPGKGEKLGKNGKPVNKGGPTRRFNQSDEERAEEEQKSAPFGKALVAGGLDWRHPGWQPNEQERQMVRVFKFAGYTDEDVARFLNMSVETLLKHFSFELQNARMAVIGDLTNRAVTRARQGNDTFVMFLLKTRGGGHFSERVAAEAALGGKDETEVLDDKRKRDELVKYVVDAIEKNSKSDKSSEEGK